MKRKISTFDLAVVVTLVLTLLKIYGVIDIAVWVVFLPLMIAVGWYCFLVFLLGLLTLMLVSKTDEGDSDEDEG